MLKIVLNMGRHLVSINAGYFCFLPSLQRIVDTYNEKKVHLSLNIFSNSARYTIVLLTVNIPSWVQIILWLLKIGVKMSQSSGQAEIQIGLDHQKPKARKIDPTFQVMIGCEAKKITEECSMSQRCRGINGYIVQKKFRLLKNNHKNKSLDFLSYYYNMKFSEP